MAGSYRGNRGSGGRPDRKETSVPPPEDVKKIIQSDDAEKLVECAENIGRGLARNEGLATSQIRSLFSEVKQIEGSIQGSDKLSPQNRRRLVLLKPKLVYQARRQVESRKGNGVTKLEQVLRPAIDSVGDNVDYFRHFVDFFEAILAYHKAAGGRD